MNSATTNASVADTIINMAKEILGVEQIPTSNIREALDSMNRLALMVEIEDHFLIVFEPEEEDAIQSFEDLVKCIEQKIEQTIQPT